MVLRFTFDLFRWNRRMLLVLRLPAGVPTRRQRKRCKRVTSGIGLGASCDRDQLSHHLRVQDGHPVRAHASW